MFKRPRIIKTDRMVARDTITMHLDNAIDEQTQERLYQVIKSTHVMPYATLRKNILQEIEEGDALFTVVFPSHELYQKSLKIKARAVLNGMLMEYYREINQDDIIQWNNNGSPIWKFIRIHGPSLKQHSLDGCVDLPIAITSGMISVRCKCPSIQAGQLLFYHFPNLETTPAKLVEAPLSAEFNLFAMDEPLAIFTMQVCEYWKLFRIQLALEFIKRREHLRFETYFPIEELILKTNIPGLTLAHLNNERNLHAFLLPLVQNLNQIIQTPFGVELWSIKDLRYIQHQTQCIQLLFVIAKYKWMNTWVGNSPRYHLEPLQLQFPDLLGTKTLEEMHLIYNIYYLLVHSPGYINIWDEMLQQVYEIQPEIFPLTSYYRTFAYMYPGLYDKKQAAISKEINERAKRFACVSQSYAKTGQMAEMHVFPSIDKIFPE